MHTTPIQNILRSLPLVAKAVLLFSVVLYTTGIGSLSTLGAWSATASIAGNSVSTGTWGDTSETIVVTPGTMGGWEFNNDRDVWSSGTGEMVEGPDTPSLGTGSARLATPGTNDRIKLRHYLPYGILISDIVELKYDTYRTSPNGGALMLALQFDVDFGPVPADPNRADARIVYEPYYTQQASLLDDTWQTWDALNDLAGTGTGSWWIAGATSLCPMGNPCTWTELNTAYPDMRISAKSLENTVDTQGAMFFKAGGSWAGFDGNVDNFIFGLTTGGTTHTITYDFEADPVVPPPPTHDDIEDFVVFGAGNVSDVHAVEANGNFTVHSGLIGSNRSVTLTGNLGLPGIRSGANVSLSGNGTIGTEGLRANDAIVKSGNITVTGPEVSGSGSFDTLELPDANQFVANGVDQSVGGNGTLTLAPGVYGTMTGSGNATLELSGGEYVFKSISMTGNTDIVLDTTMGAIEIYVAETVGLEGEISLTETVSTASAKIYLEAGEVINLGANTKWYGTAYSTMDRNPALPGITAQGNIEVFGALYSNQQVKFNGNADLTLVGPIFETYSGPAPVTIDDVVLNEIYPAPLTSGNPSAPYDREWIEIYNGSNVPVDVEGWKVSEIAASVEVPHVISSANTCASGFKEGYARPFDGASTEIAPGGLLIVELCAETRLNQTGGGTVETVRLYTSTDTLLDTHGYGATVAGKSHQRIPDGGIWVDPEPTPGESNRVSREDLINEGFTDEQIEYIIALLARRGEYLIGEEPVEEEPVPEITIEELLPETPSGGGGSSPVTETLPNPEDDEAATESDDTVDDDTTPSDDEAPVDDTNEDNTDADDVTDTNDETTVDDTDAASDEPAKTENDESDEDTNTESDGSEDTDGESGSDDESADSDSDSDSKDGAGEDSSDDDSGSDDDAGGDDSSGNDSGDSSDNSDAE